MKRVQLEIVLGTIFVLLSAGIVLVMGLRETERLEEYKQGQQAELIEAGAGVYEQNCTGCHGHNAGGITGLAPCLRCEDFFTTRIGEVGWEGSLEDYVISVVTTGRQVSTRPDQYVGGGSPAMPTWSQEFGGPLRKDEIRAVAAFIMSFENWAMDPERVPTPLVVEIDTTDPVARGQLVYNQMGCGACHTISGISTGTVGPALNGIAIRAGEGVEGLTAEEYIRDSILDPNAFVVEGFPEGVMPQDFGERLTEEQLSDLLAFLLTLEEE